MDLYRTRKDFNSIRIAYRDRRNRLGDSVRTGSCDYRSGSASIVPAAGDIRASNGGMSLPQTERSAGSQKAALRGPGGSGSMSASQPYPHQQQQQEQLEPLGDHQSRSNSGSNSAQRRILQVAPAPQPPPLVVTPRREQQQQQQQQWPRNDNNGYPMAAVDTDEAAGEVLRLPRVSSSPPPPPNPQPEGGSLTAANGSLPVMPDAARSEQRPKRPQGQRYPDTQQDTQKDTEADLDTERMPATGNTTEATYQCSLRLKKITQLVEKDEITKETLIKNLNYAVKVLESVYIDETSPEEAVSVSDTRRVSSPRAATVTVVTERLCNDEDELPEVPSGEVPNEVRDWLATTFTRSQTSLKQNREKPKFRSVANAIRAGIMVERIYRRLSSSSNINVPPNVLVLLKSGLDDWCFNIFELNEVSDNHALKFVGFELLHKYDLINKFKISANVLENFLVKCEEGYSKFGNPYHNLVHGADVAQTCHYIMSSSKLVNWLTDLEIFATIVAAIIHDYEHTGTTNNFHVNTSSDLALLYNDKGVLENHHASAVFRLMRQDEFNILTGLSREEYKEFRALVIDMVLNTDMSLHFQQLKNMKQLLSVPENIDKEKALALMLHCADISHPGKRWDLHHRWTMSLLEEFFRQGDREKALDLPCSPLCDRSTTMVAQSQVGFIDFIMEPTFAVLGDMLEKILVPLFEQQQRQHQQQQQHAGGSRPVTEETPAAGADGVFVLHRPWSDLLKANRAQWKAKADIEEAERAAAAAAAAADSNADEAGKADEEEEDGKSAGDVSAKPQSKDPEAPQQPAATLRQLDTIKEDKDKH